MMSDTIVMSLQQGTTDFHLHTSYEGSSAVRVVDISSRPLRFCYVVKASDTYAGSQQTMDFISLNPITVTPFGAGSGYFGYRYIENGSYYCEYLFTSVKCGTNSFSNVPTQHVTWALFFKPASGTVYQYSMTFDRMSRSCVWLHTISGSYNLSFRILTDVQASAVLDWLDHLLKIQSGVVRSIT